MSTEKVVTISREELFQPLVDKTLEHQKALARQAAPPPGVEETVSPLRRFLLSSLFYTPLAGALGGLTTWGLLEPMLDERDNKGTVPVAGFLVFPMLAALVVLFIYLSEGVASRKLFVNVGRWASGVGLTILLTILAYIPIGWLMYAILLLPNPPTEQTMYDLTMWDPSFFFGVVVLRSCAWAIAGAALGMGMNMVRSTSAQLRASVMGGTVGGALGGMLFDPINRFLLPSAETGNLMRFVGLCLVGAAVGLFVALAERLGRDGWVRVRTGPLAGKAFILYRNPTVIGSSPQSDIYLFKDLGIDATHAALHRVAGHYELEALVSDKYTVVNGRPVARRRLVSGDQITLGDTVMDFEERLQRRAVADGPIKEK